ncbi:MAG: Flp pilus assembly complex ATPase component TadA, partial [Nitrospinae bacterium]|nr:Flp pilus assembly complex ATPase component TadA [Nitrospinota bacterium]
GESMVVRLLSTGPDRRSLADLGMAPDTLAAYRAALDKGWGMIVVTGPTGAGKTTTLYATLATLAGPTRTAVSVEDPVERRLPFVRQSQVNRRAGFTFPVGIKHALRQDPDILMVGEIRDAETARAAAQGALTGHLTLTSLHTGDAAGAIDRLVDLGVERYQIAAIFRGALAQRLVRAFCVSCGGKGCPRCHGEGYRGRIGLFEFLPADDELREMIRNGAPASALREKAARIEGYVSLADDGRRKVADGITDTVELVRGLHGL